MLHSNTFCQTVILIVKSHSGLSRGLAFLTLASCLCTLAGCGQQGPLYLPDAQMPHGKTAIKSKGKTPTLPPASAATSDTSDTGNNNSTAIVPVTPSIPD
jgi:predicted small lipoprotein YifL